MRKDILWEPFFNLAFHLKLTSWPEFYHMPVRMRNWLLERTAEEYKKQNEMQESEAKHKNKMYNLSEEGHKIFEQG